jgi:selenocysteine lyase/cysteine desulfurase
MHTNRRQFLHKFSALAIATPFLQTAQGKSMLRVLEENKHRDIDELVRDEHYWYQIKQAYTVSPSVMNLNNGGVCPQPKVVQEALERYNKVANEAPSYYMWQILDQGREPLRTQLANLAGCSPDELAINRNASEALETVIFGLRLKAGDEVVLTKQDYPNMINAWKQREKRDGIVLKWISFDFPMENAEAITRKFAEAFSPKTKVVQITHVINWTGQILPVRDIAREARKRGIDVLVDAAHSFAHINYKISDLDCDYWGTSLHKWLCAPFGSGLLYVKKDKIKNLYPLFGANDPESEDIRKFENLGTRSFPIEQAIGQALHFHNMIGSDLKERRLHYLKNYWAERVSQLPGVTVKTSLLPAFACALAIVAVDGMTPAEVSSYLFREFKIHTVAIEWENISGVRITPNVYTTTDDLDILVRAFSKMTSK